MNYPNTNPTPKFGCQVRGCLAWLILLFILLCVLRTTITIQRESPWVKIEFRCF